jgi:hypothetical protein
MELLVFYLVTLVSFGSTAQLGTSSGRTSTEQRRTIVQVGPSPYLLMATALLLDLASMMV